MKYLKTYESRENIKELKEDLKKLLYHIKNIVDSLGPGGISGKPVTRRSTEMIHYIHQKSEGSIPMIAVGGIHSAQDALDKLSAGASLVQLYTGFIYEGPALVKAINKSLLKGR
jgi:dihydroorotate dehydrogenase